MHNFEVEQRHTMDSGQSQRVKELILQVRAMENFYAHLGIDSENARKIFKLTLGYLEGNIQTLEIKSFFDALMKQNKVLSEKELNLLNCFDELVDKNEEELSAEKLVSDNAKSNFGDDMPEVA